MKQSIGNFLLRRLKEAGVKHLFGVPGDYNLELMQQLEDLGDPAWIGNCNELNGSYATDAYARINGIGALIVTHGVGALSAINGIAGAYSEHVPVICISGSLPLRAVQHGDLMHHTLANREKGNFCRMFAEVTEAQAQLTPENEVAEIDRLILTAWRCKLPVYLELPSDIGYLEVEVPERPLRLEMIPSDPGNLKACTAIVLERLKAARSPAFLLDLAAMRFGVSGEIMELAQRFEMRVATLNCAKGAFSETSPHFVGTYAGSAVTRSPTPTTDHVGHRRRRIRRSHCRNDRHIGTVACSSIIARSIEAARPLGMPKIVRLPRRVCSHFAHSRGPNPDSGKTHGIPVRRMEWRKTYDFPPEASFIGRAC
jgi:indolepyruvate decarboxylase